jgi:hypothetical protein
MVAQVRSLPLQEAIQKTATMVAHAASAADLAGAMLAEIQERVARIEADQDASHRTASHAANSTSP